jgi:membrane-bound lytic murein transglycosylase B
MRAVVVGVVVVAAVLAALIAGSQAGVRTTNAIRRPSGQTGRLTSTAVLPQTPPADPGQLATDLNQAQTMIDNPASSTAQLANAAWFEQLASLAIERAQASNRRTTLSRLDPDAAATMRANLAAGAALKRLETPRRKLPHWKIVQPPPPGALLGYLKGAQNRFAVPWEYLAAIELIETKFGRVVGLSTAGAEGPMQFLPATWARYGSGDVHNQRDAILGAARYLRASGAPGDMAGALYHYNPSADYVAAVTDFANRMRADPRAFYGYYYQQVIYDKLGGRVLLPVGFPRSRPVPLR